MSAFRLYIRRAPAALFAFAVGFVGGVYADRRMFSVEGAGSLELDLPSGWEATVEGEGAEGGPAIQIKPPRNVPLVLLVTPIPFQGRPKELARRVEEAGRRIAENLGKVAVESPVPTRLLEGPRCRGLYASATDRTVERPTDQDFKYADQGVLAAGKMLVTFTILTNVKDAPERSEALNIVRSVGPAGMLSIDALMVEPDEIGEGCKPIEGQHYVSVQAGLVYEMGAEALAGNVEPDRKAYRSIECAGEKLTIYYYQYASQADALKAEGDMKDIVWGEKAPSRLHPESIFAMNNIVVVVSGAKPEDVAERIRELLHQERQNR